MHPLLIVLLAQLATTHVTDHNMIMRPTVQSLRKWDTQPNHPWKNSVSGWKTQRDVCVQWDGRFGPTPTPTTATMWGLSCALGLRVEQLWDSRVERAGIQDIALGINVAMLRRVHSGRGQAMLGIQHGKRYRLDRMPTDWVSSPVRKRCQRELCVSRERGGQRQLLVGRP